MPVAVVPISSKPHFITLDEHRDLVASTPASFSDIPPVLRHQEDNVAVALDPPLAGFSEDDCAKGTLYIIESVLAFVSASGRGFQVEYPSITLHAISREESGPSIYCQLEDISDGAQAASADDDEVSQLKELRLIPQSAASLEPIFEALSICAALHPDPAGESDDDMGMDEAFVDADESRFETFAGDDGQELTEAGRVALEYLESIIYDPHGPQHQTNGVQDDHADAKEASDAEESNGEAGPTTGSS